MKDLERRLSIEFIIDLEQDKRNAERARAK
jgi:hypothetical protein